MEGFRCEIGQVRRREAVLSLACGLAARPGHCPPALRLGRLARCQHACSQERNQVGDAFLNVIAGKLTARQVCHPAVIQLGIKQRAEDAVDTPEKLAIVQVAAAAA